MTDTCQCAMPHSHTPRTPGAAARAETPTLDPDTTPTCCELACYEDPGCSCDGCRAETPGLDAALSTLSEDDLMYDYPIAMSGEPMDPVLFVRWDAILAALTGDSDD